jgi:glycosyltransferase involved in cell wall biosynthesis
MDLKLSVIIPCYNEEEVIAATYARVDRSLKNAGASRREIVFINDGSRDRTLEILRTIAHTNPDVRVLSFSRNFGHQPAVAAGIENCTGDVAVIIDADLQDPPELIGDMVRIHISQEANIVYGLRTSRRGESFFKKLSAYLFYRLLGFLSDTQKPPKNTGDFRLIDRRIIDTFKTMPERKEYLRGLIHWMGFKQVALPYQREERYAGQTKYPFRKMLKFASHGVQYFSAKPLKLATTVGLFSIAVGILLAIYVLFMYFSKTASLVPGWASTVITIIFFGGVQLLCLGILGSYLAIVFDEVKKRPQYIIQESINAPEDPVA